MDTKLKTGGKKPLATPSTGSQKVKPAISFVPRMLTPSEQEFLRQDLKNTLAEARAIKI
jgi:hypothetical protein